MDLNVVSFILSYQDCERHFCLGAEECFDTARRSSETLSGRMNFLFLICIIFLKRSLGAIQAPTSSWRPSSFAPFRLSVRVKKGIRDWILC